ncbi:aspartate--tRNA(Asn) ligase [Anaerosporobacter faecicola]|uniref:aspartate--tRNA(Asn) ligase n=1 Tax=Anaerosporobacter faecicola TaxID=2718714 RepID=UPI00143B8E0E|nr:aspartate--tRNA(Asn) ligase [Anaerosporobacter faecicola]
MEFISGIKEKETVSIYDIIYGDDVAGNRVVSDTTVDSQALGKCAMEGKVVSVDGAVHTIRDMGDFAFLVLRKQEGVIQCVFNKEQTSFDLKTLKEGATIEVQGMVAKEERAPHGFEIRLNKITVLSMPSYDTMLPIPISKWKLKTSLETKLTLRPISLRNIRERAIFKIQEGLVRGFRDFMFSQEFTEVRTPKIVAGNAEGGANVFKLEYFGKKAFLAQSPQFYKQTMVGVYDRVFEVGPVFRAEKHNTTRHLNEYTGLDFEMGYIRGFEEIMEMEQAMLAYTFQFLKETYSKELDLLDVKLPDASKIPAVRFDEAKRLVSEKYDRKIKNPYDLEPEEEILIGKYFLEEYGSDLVFVTHYPSKKRPFYAMDDPTDPKFTLSFDLLFKGMEITTGGQRIHEYDSLVAKMEARGMDPEDFANYLMIFKYGMPPHGGLGIGLERLTMRLLDEVNVRETTLFPRDVTRLEP